VDWRAAYGHPPLQGEGRTAFGGPGWGDGDAAYAEALPPPPGPLVRADLPLQGEVTSRASDAQSVGEGL
jgi:hypothetical protein